jgi:3-hydroxyisobutyrate dehydrogenase
MQHLRVGFVGLGDIGEPMARKVIDANFPVTLWARREASLEQFRDVKYERATSLFDLAQESDVVELCVGDENDLRDVVLRDGGILAGIPRGGIILVHSIVSVESVLELENICWNYGIIVMDAPVDGSRDRALAGELSVMAGGPKDSFEMVRPILEAFSSHVDYLGPTGSGLKMKALSRAC